MRYNQLQLTDRKLFDSCLVSRKPRLAAYAFEAIFMWRPLYEIFWVMIRENLCVFFKDAVGCFLFLPPLGTHHKEYAVEESFAIMKRFNRNSLVSRIENIPEEEREWYGACGYDVRQACVDYVCRRSDIAQLKGKAYKKKRASADFFCRHYDFEFRPYCSGDKEECCLLFESWIKGRKEKYGDGVYRQLLDDNFTAFKTVAEHYESLRFCGYVIRVKNELKAFTMGYPLGEQYFVVAFEICDLSVRGIAPFIFREFCRRLEYDNINIMDDCGLENLRFVKDSYRPYKKERIYIARCHE